MEQNNELKTNRIFKNKQMYDLVELTTVEKTGQGGVTLTSYLKSNNPMENKRHGDNLVRYLSNIGINSYKIQKYIEGKSTNQEVILGTAIIQTPMGTTGTKEQERSRLATFSSEKGPEGIQIIHLTLPLTFLMTNEPEALKGIFLPELSKRAESHFHGYIPIAAGDYINKTTIDATKIGCESARITNSSEWDKWINIELEWKKSANAYLLARTFVHKIINTEIQDNYTYVYDNGGLGLGIHIDDKLIATVSPKNDADETPVTVSIKINTEHKDTTYFDTDKILNKIKENRNQDINIIEL